MSWRLIKVSENSDTATNGLEITVPENRLWHILTMWIELTTSDSAGNRQIEVHVLDTSSDVIFGLRTPLVQAASLTYYYGFSPGTGHEDTGIMDTDFAHAPLPTTFLIDGKWRLKFFDNSTTDLDSDVWQVHIIANQKPTLAHVGG
jgi:hypothetical protein